MVFKKKVITVLSTIILMLSLCITSASASETHFGFSVDAGKYKFSNACKKTSSGSASVYINEINVGYNTEYISFSIYSQQTYSSSYKVSYEYIIPSWSFNLNYSSTVSTNNNYYLLCKAYRRVVTCDGYWYS